MIERYCRPEMSQIFSLENKYRLWTEIEVLAAEAQAELGQIGISVADAVWIRVHAGFDAARIAELEQQLQHDFIAFLTDLGEHVDAEVASDAPRPSRWLHFGMTSTDVEDTTQNFLLTQAADLLLSAVRALGRRCRERALEFRETICIGRTHGVQAEPMVFGLKFGAWAWALKRAELRLGQARTGIAVGAISGAVGTYSSLDPAIEQHICDSLGLAVDPLSTQVVARDRHAQFVAALATTAATLEQMATEIRLLQQTEILEAAEPFASGQKGSSAMPHKRNPVVAERICGLSRLVKANVQMALDDVALWHERDISHSSVERVMLADSCQVLDYLLDQMLWLVDGLVVYPQRCLANLEATRGLIYSSKTLLALVEKGLSREQAYALVQRHSLAVWADIQIAQPGPSLAERLAADVNCPLSADDWLAICDPRAFLTHLDVLFDRLQRLEFG